MPNKQAAIKDLRKNKKRAAHNESIKRNVKALFKKAKEATGAEAKEAARKLQQAVDKAAKVGVIHRNKANRRKSVVAKLVK